MKTIINYIVFTYFKKGKAILYNNSSEGIVINDFKNYNNLKLLGYKTILNLKK